MNVDRSAYRHIDKITSPMKLHFLLKAFISCFNEMTAVKIYIYIYIAFYNKRVFLETVSQIGPKVMMYNQNTVYILGLNFFKDFWYDWKRWEAVESQRLPVNCQ